MTLSVLLGAHSLVDGNTNVIVALTSRYPLYPLSTTKGVRPKGLSLTQYSGDYIEIPAVTCSPAECFATMVCVLARAYAINRQYVADVTNADNHYVRSRCEIHRFLKSARVGFFRFCFGSKEGATIVTARSFSFLAKTQEDRQHQ